MIEAAVRPERILKDLRNLWVDLGKNDPAGVLRACAMTLIVLVEEERDAQAIGETLACLMHEHPSRAIVLRVRSGDEESLSARVFAQCWTPFGGRQQICCEQVEIISSLRSFTDVTSVLRALVVPDLPVVLYCPSEGLWPLPEFAALLPLASKLIINSDDMDSAPSALTYLAGVSNTAAFTESGFDLVAADALAPVRGADFRRPFAHALGVRLGRGADPLPFASRRNFVRLLFGGVVHERARGQCKDTNRSGRGA
jgi:hypothetical protein